VQTAVVCPVGTEDTAGLSHCAAAVERGVPITARRSGGETSKTSGHRAESSWARPGRRAGAQRESWASQKVLAHAGRQMPGCFAAPPSGGEAPRPHILTASSPLPLPSALVLLLLRKRRSRVWAAPAELMCSTNVSLGLSYGPPFIVYGPRTRSSPFEGSTLLLPCSFKNAFIKIKEKTPTVVQYKKHRKCFRSGSAAARKQTVLSHPHLQQTAKSTSQTLLIKKKTTPPKTHLHAKENLSYESWKVKKSIGKC